MKKHRLTINEVQRTPCKAQRNCTLRTVLYLSFRAKRGISQAAIFCMHGMQKKRTEKYPMQKIAPCTLFYALFYYSPLSTVPIPN